MYLFRKTLVLLLLLLSCLLTTFSSGTALVYSTFLGGDKADNGKGIAVDSAGYVYITGYTNSNDFPTTAGVYSSSSIVSLDIFVAKLNPTGTALVYSTHFGGSGNNFPYGFSIDSAGNAYVSGYTQSTDFPTTLGAYKTSFSGGICDAFVVKLNSTGTALVYSTYLGGSAFDRANDMTVDIDGNAYVAGITESTDFPTTIGSYATNSAGNADVFVTKLNATGTTLIYSTYLGGSSYENAYGIAVDSANNAYVIGATGSTNFPTTAGAFATNSSGYGDGFITKLNATGTALIYSTYLGGTSDDVVYGVSVDVAGNTYVTGHTESKNFPTTAGAYDRSMGGLSDGFIFKLNPTGTALVYSTYLGGSGDDYVNGITIDSAGNVYVIGDTYSTDFPTTSGAYSNTSSGGKDIFVTKLNPTGTALDYSTYLGGNNTDIGFKIVIDPAENIYVTGYTYSNNFPVTIGTLDTSYSGTMDTFVTKLSTNLPLTVERWNCYDGK